MSDELTQAQRIAALERELSLMELSRNCEHANWIDEQAKLRDVEQANRVAADLLAQADAARVAAEASAKRLREALEKTPCCCVSQYMGTKTSGVIMESLRCVRCAALSTTAPGTPIEKRSDYYSPDGALKWGHPVDVGHLILQLQTLDPAMKAPKEPIDATTLAYLEQTKNADGDV